MHSPESISALISKLRNASEAADFVVEDFGQIDLWPLLGMRRAASSDASKSCHIYLSAGIHGDEPAPPQALLELLESDALPRRHHYYICPLLNPAGLAMGTRETPDGIDLNRDYRDFASLETKAHAQWIQRHIRQLDCAIHLHEDWESQGVYLYELNLAGHPSYSARILAAMTQILPQETADCIDGYPAQRGIIKPETLPDIADGHPEAIYLQQQFGGLNYTLETPSAMNFRKRVDALKAAVAITFAST